MISFGTLVSIVACLSFARKATGLNFVTDPADEYIADRTKLRSISTTFDDIRERRRSADEDYPRTRSISPVPSATRTPIDSATTNVAHHEAIPKLTRFDGRSGGDYKGVQVLSRRDKRSLTFPDPSTILVIFGLGTPLQLDRESIIMGAFTKFIYNLPLNSTDFTEPGVYFARKKSRWSIYKVLERASELYGYVGGKGCLLRAICEVAAAPFDLRHGLFGQMAQAFLTPSSTSEAYDEYGDREYHAAERLGRNADENCHALYPECERSFLDVFSTVVTTGTPITMTTTAPNSG